MKTALIIIDVQNGFISENTKDIPDKIVSYLENNNFDFILFTQFVNSEYSNFFKQLNWKKSMFPPDTEIHASLVKYIKKNNTFTKSTYSIFKASNLLQFLTANKISKLTLCGFNTDECVLASAFEAFDLGFEIQVIDELCASYMKGDLHKAALDIIHHSVQPLP